MASQKDTAKALLNEYGETFAEQLGINAEKNTPSQLFQLLCASILFSARINSDIAADAFDNLMDRGWTTADNMTDSTWQQRVDALNDGGYTRYQERTSTILGDAAEHVQEEYGGDLRALRDKAERDPARERDLLKEIKGIGDVGVDIFFREVQVAWEELYPFVDGRARDAAKALDLPPDRLTELASRSDFPRLVAALVRVSLNDEEDKVLEAAEAS